MKYALYIIVGIIIINILVRINKKSKYKKIMKKNKSIKDETTVDLNDETSPLCENKLLDFKYNLKIKKNIVVVHSETTID